MIDLRIARYDRAKMHRKIRWTKIGEISAATLIAIYCVWGVIAINQLIGLGTPFLPWQIFLVFCANFAAFGSIAALWAGTVSACHRQERRRRFCYRVSSKAQMTEWGG